MQNGITKVGAAVLCGVWLFAGCQQGGPGVAADDAAQALGIESYTISSDAVEVFAHSGLWGVVKVEVPSADARLVRIEHGADAPDIVEIGRPRPDGTFLAPVDIDRVGQILADPSLAAFFAARGLTFRAEDLAAIAPRSGLDPESTARIASCYDTWPFAAACTATNCYNQQGSGTLAPGHTLWSWTGTCGAACDAAFGTGNTWGVIEGTSCACYTSYTSTLDRHAKCPTASCAAGYYDEVSKRETCISPSGSCSYTAQSWDGTCIAKPVLSVSKSGSGTVTSSPAGISCGGTCSSWFDDNTAVALTATPASFWRFMSWSGACSGSGTCNVTMSSNKSATATFNQCVGYLGDPCSAGELCCVNSCKQPGGAACTYPDSGNCTCGGTN